MELQKIRNKKIVFLVGISVLVLLAPGTYLTITNNSSIYLSQALELSMGHPPYILKEGLVARGPVFIGVMATLFTVTGPSVIFAFFLMKVIYAGVLIVTFWFARTCYNNATAILSVLIACSSIALYKIGISIDADTLLVTLFLLFFIFLHTGLKKNKVTHYILSGIFLSLSFLTKETAIFFLFFILCLTIYSFIFDKKKSYNLLLLLITFIVFLLPWIIYVYYKTSSTLPVLGHFNPQFHQQYSSTIGSDIKGVFIKGLFQHIVDFYKMFNSVTFLAPLLLLGFIIHIIRLITRVRKGEPIISEGLLTAGIIFYLPVPLSDIAIGAAAPRQGIIIYLLLFIVFGHLIFLAWERLLKKHINKFLIAQYKRYLLPMTILIIIAVITAGFFIRIEMSSPLYHYISVIKNYKIVPEITERFTFLHEKGAEWVQENIPKGNTIIVDGYLGEILGFFTRYQYKFKESFQPVISSSYLYRRPVIFLITYKKFQSSEKIRRFFWIMDEFTILDELKKGDIIAFSNKTKFLKEYFNRVHWAKNIYSNDDIYIYKLIDNPMQSDVFENQNMVFVNESFFEDMEWLRANHSGEFNESLKLIGSMNIAYDELTKNKYKLKGIFF